MCIFSGIVLDEGSKKKGEYAFIADDNYIDIVLTISKCMNANSSNGWYLDSSCVTHVWSWKDYFDLLQEGVAVEFDFWWQINYEWYGSWCCENQNVWWCCAFFGGVVYVKKLCKNLKLLSLLDSQRYGFSANGGVVKVTRGDMILMKGNLHYGLYHLEGEASKRWEQCTSYGIYCN